jgi:hypothetical protein
MAGYPAFHPNRRSQNRRPVPVDQISLLSSTIIAGLGMFGLAANGACLTALMQCGSQDPAKLPADPDMAGEAADTTLFLVSRDRSRTGSRRVSQCQH